jgi:glycerophosphoryl diester phosphodiesterase
MLAGLNAPDWLVSRPIAHRGLHAPAARRYENSLSAFKAAVSAGFAMECDLQISRDGEAMVFHDFTLERLTSETGPVREQTSAALKSMAIRDSDDHIPTFGDLLSLVDGRVPIVVEIKSRFDGDLRLTERAIAVAGGYAGPLCFKSFDARIVAALRVLCPDRPRGIIAMSSYVYPDFARLEDSERHALANLLHFPDTAPDFVSWRVGELPCAAPFFTRDVLGLPLMAWTVRTEADRALCARHADQMVFEGFEP